MELLSQVREILLGVIMVVLALCLLASLIRAILGPRFTDRIVAINMIGTQTILLICILSFLIGEQYLVDISLIYAMISFLAVVAMVNLYLSVFREKVVRRQQEEQILQDEHEIELATVEHETADTANVEKEEEA